MSNSTRQLSRRRYKAKLGRLLRRGAYIRAAEFEDWPFFWAAYNAGCFSGNIEPGLPLDEFREEFSAVEASIADFYVATTPVGDRKIPVGVIVSFGGGDHPVWHASWFPWAQPRQIMECSAKFLHLMRAEGIMGFVQKNEVEGPSQQFMDYFCELGLIRRVGRVLHHYGIDKHMVLYQQTVKKP